MRKIRHFSIAVVIASVSTTTAVAVDASDYPPPMKCFLDASRCNYLIGKRVWVRPIKLEKVSICPTDYWQCKNRDPDPCKYVRSGTLTIIGIESHGEYTHDFLVKLDNGSNALVDKSNVLSLSLVDAVAVAKAARDECERRGHPKIGMTPEEAMASCWAKPLKVVKTTTANGVQEDYIYNRGRILRFVDGKLSVILETSGR